MAIREDITQNAPVDEADSDRSWVELRRVATERGITAETLKVGIAYLDSHAPVKVPRDTVSASEKAALADLGGTAVPDGADLFRLETANEGRLIAAMGRLVDASYTAPQVQELLGLNGQVAVRDRRRDKGLYAFSGPSGATCFPRWQFFTAENSRNKALPGLPKVLRTLGEDLHPLVVDEFFTTPREDLVVRGQPVTPAAWLASGGPADRVVDAAVGLAVLG